MPLLVKYLCYWSCKHFINICPLGYSFLTQHESCLPVTLRRRHMGWPCLVCSVLEKTVTRDKAGWVTPMTCSSFPAALFPMGVFFMWLEAHLPRDQNTDTLIMRQVGCRAARWVFVCHSPRWDEYLLCNKPLEVCNVTWTNGSVCPAWFIQITRSLLSKG